jgi:hypothetical protein
MMIALSTTLGYTAVMEEQRLHALDERHLAAWRTFITAHAALIDAIERDLRGAGVISLTWYDVLIELARRRITGCGCTSWRGRWCSAGAA